MLIREECRYGQNCPVFSFIAPKSKIGEVVYFLMPEHFTYAVDRNQRSETEESANVVREGASNQQTQFLHTRHTIVWSLLERSVAANQ